MTIDDLSARVDKIDARVKVIEDSPSQIAEGWIAHAWATVAPLFAFMKSAFPYILCALVGFGAAQLKGCNPFPPTPPIPNPVDPLIATLKASYVADGSPAAQGSLLVAVYQNSTTIVHDTTLKTNQDVLQAMHKAAQVVLPDTALQKTRRSIGDELNKQLGTAIVPLTDALRNDIDTQFHRVYAALTEAMK